MQLSVSQEVHQDDGSYSDNGVAYHAHQGDMYTIGTYFQIQGFTSNFGDSLPTFGDSRMSSGNNFLIQIKSKTH